MYIPHTDPEREQMLKAIGKDRIEDLFTDIPEQFRFPDLDLPSSVTEMEAAEQIEGLASANNHCGELICFLGAGAYNHYIPAAVDMILRRGDFFTAYTPYQPEISQGTLQAIFEFQSMIVNLTGMDVSNASHYDGASASAEACLTAYSQHRGKCGKFLLSPTLHPHYRETIRTYLNSLENVEIDVVDLDDTWSYKETLKERIDENTALVFVQYPDFLGQLDDFSDLGKAAHQKGALLAVAANPTALGLIKPPSQFGADIVVGEGQPLGIPLSFGGPYLGFFAAKNELVRKISGRIVGETEDKEGNRGYVLTLTAREQHIRREKATSNICTNQGLMALAATVYLSTLGKNGLQEVAKLCFRRAHYAAERISFLKGYDILSNKPFFHEFVIKCPKNASDINRYLLENGILGGLDLSKYFPGKEELMLVAVTEKNSIEEIDLLVHLLKEAAHA